MSSTVKYTVCVDALQMLCTGKIPVLHDNAPQQDNYIFTDGIRLQRNYLLNHPGFNYCFNIFLGEKIFGQVFYSNSHKYRYAHDDICQVNIENHVLYQAELACKLNMVLDNLELEFYKYSYMEIAVDGHDLIKQHNQMTYSSKIARTRSVKIQPLLNEKTKENISYRIGSEKSEKHISIYNKTMEIVKSKKEYIAEFWERNELAEMDLQIDRCELRSRDKVLKNFTDDFTQLENPSYLASFFQSVAGHYLEFYSKKNSKTRYHLIDWSLFEEIQITKKAMTRKSYNVNRYKGMLRNLFEEYALTQDEKYLYTLASITARYNLIHWIHHAVPRWIREFRLSA